MQDSLKLQAAVARLVDVANLSRLAARYVACIYRGWKPDTFDALDGIFTADAIYELLELGVIAEGRDAIKSSLVAETQDLVFSHHSLTDPVFAVDGDEATADWKMWIISASDDDRCLVLGRLRLICRRVDADWLIAGAAVRIGSAIMLGDRQPPEPSP